MANFNEIKKEIAGMSQLALKMWEATYLTFMEHDLDLLAIVLLDEETLNNLEKKITTALVEFNRSTSSKEEKACALIFAEIVEDLELIGDYCKDILERVQIKIEEKLLFSEEAVKEYEALYQKTRDALNEVTRALVKDDPQSVGAVLNHEGHIDNLVDEYRKKHNQRMVDGVCSPLACNMFLNMLDFTAAIYYHTKKIARNLLKIKNV